MHSLPLYGPSQLCRYDTVLCTLVLECAKIGFTVRKIEYDRDSPKDGRLACGDIPVDHSFLEDAIIKIIKSKVVTGNDSRSASDELLKLLSHRKCSGLLKYIEKVPNSTMHTPYEGVGSYIERSEFMKLATAYFNIYGPHSEIEVGQSPKYNTPNDGCIITTSRIEKGHFIKGLEGILVKLSKDDSTNLDGRDLSIIFMTQKKLTCILLGPARFVNHDCTPNCAFVTPCSKSKKIFLKALKQIDPGTELTVYYGKHYFSQENGDCMCSTCER